MRLLVIDKEWAFRNSLKEILEMEQHHVDTAEDGLVGLNLARENDYDAIFCEVMTPSIDGVEVLSAIIGESIRSKVIMITGKGDIELAVDCMRMGAFDFIPKPLDLNRVLLTLKNAADVQKTTMSYHVIIVDPSDTFTRDLDEEFRHAGLVPVDYAGDAESLRQILPLHLHPDVSSAMKSDAVLVNLWQGGIKAKRCVSALLNREIPVFYFSSDSEFRPDSLGDYWEAIQPTFINYQHLKETILKELVTRYSPEVVEHEKYPEFFKAAERFDRDFGWNLVEFSAKALLRGYKLNDLRIKLDDTVIRYLQQNRVAPYFFKNGAVPRLLAQQYFNDKDTGLSIRLKDIPQKEYLAEQWIRTAFLSVYQYVNAGSHSKFGLLSRKHSSETVFHQFMAFIVWLDGVRSRYENGEIHFEVSGFKNKQVTIPLQAVRKKAEDSGFCCGDTSLEGNDLMEGDMVVILPNMRVCLEDGCYVRRTGYFIAVGSEDRFK